MGLLEQVPDSWRPILADLVSGAELARIHRFVEEERAAGTVFPPPDDVFNALRYTPYDRVSVLIVGQDPYHDDGQAHGLAFSVRPGVKVPPSLVNIYKELETDLGIPRARSGHLKCWADQGVLLLNTALTVRAHAPASHKGQWDVFTDAVIRAVDARPERVVFVLWGGHAQKKAGLIDADRHTVVQSAHPSPLSAKKFFGSKPFSTINEVLRQSGRPTIDWTVR